MVDIEFLGIRVILLRQSLHARPCLAQDAHMGRKASVRDAGEEGGGNLAVTLVPLPRNEFTVVHQI